MRRPRRVQGFRCGGRSLFLLPLLLLAGVLCVPAAYAYRPFDGTDASVPDAGEFELELGPVQHLREGSETMRCRSSRCTAAAAAGEDVREVRAGLTWSFSLH